MTFKKLYIILPGEIREKCPVFLLKSLLRINHLYNPLPLNKVPLPRQNINTDYQMIFSVFSLYISSKNILSIDRRFVYFCCA